ncbi:hypothetical protein JJB09_25510 [Rhizobium sp. KVB221]|uniref:Uncharacterized protein n=1 Tax=Rhizobium setariae TaxID=2801340 RepID=A0A936YRG6_9HYPH|nr:hypothetical protein [Rhizobium setariae]MBL0375373.1 hypothetical protein [Rhizobium setariae]
MIARIAKALAAGVAAIWRGITSIADDVLNFALAPLRALGGGHGNMPEPSFTPDVEPRDLLTELRAQSEQSSAPRAPDRDALRTVTQYANASQAQRPTVDLSGLSKGVQATLLTMDEHELKALSTAGPAAVRRFIDGKQHGIHGVPVVRTVNEPDSRALDVPQQVLLERVRRAPAKAATSEPHRALRM